MFRHADVVCLCFVCILWQFSMLRSAFIYSTVMMSYDVEKLGGYIV